MKKERKKKQILTKSKKKRKKKHCGWFSLICKTFTLSTENSIKSNSLKSEFSHFGCNVVNVENGDSKWRLNGNDDD